ncbi:hypothetical protein M514_21551 [Trichuris suis]|uniref:Uncharacterized protein n=1 Tax=Trichuris suis TaxID=68888 RepID=A0A085N9W8_9BILA|nr:hypothetical protein M514_21551 [Trichuris suis]
MQRMVETASSNRQRDTGSGNSRAVERAWKIRHGPAFKLRQPNVEGASRVRPNSNPRRDSDEAWRYPPDHMRSFEAAGQGKEIGQVSPLRNK